MPRVQVHEYREYFRQHDAVKSAIEADHIVPVHRAPDPNRRHPPFSRRLNASETGEGSIRLGNEPSELTDADLVAPLIAADDARDETRIELM